jgi:hypothetical protein
MIIAVLVVATIADLALAALMVAVSGFFFGAGPESMQSGGFAMAAYSAGVIACLAAPVAGFFFNARGQPRAALTVALLPPAGALLALMVPAPY